MLIKIIGCGVIVASSAKIGWDVAQGYAARVREIRAFQSGLGILRNEISFHNTVLSDALKSASNVRNKQVAQVFQRASDRLAAVSNMTAAEAWSEAMSACKPILSIKKDETEVLLEFGSQLGTGTIDDTLCTIQNAEEKLKLCERASADEERRYAKLYRSLGVIAGLFLAIIFI